MKAEYLGRLASRLKREGISNVTLIHGEPGDPKLPPAAIDLAILAHMYHEIENPYEFLYRLRPSFAPNARLAIVDLDQPSATGRSTSSCSPRQTATSRSSSRPTRSPPVEAIRPCPQ